MNAKIDWGRYFDHIYCLCYLGSEHQAVKRRLLEAELTRTGILGSGVFSWQYTTPDPWDEVISGRLRKRVLGSPAANVGFINLGLATARIFREAKALGYRRILVLEDDVAFLKDLREVEIILENIPDRSLVMFDKFLDWGLTLDEYMGFVREHTINPCFFEGRELHTVGGVAFSVDQTAMSFYIRRYENPDEGPHAADSYFDCFPDRAVAIKSLAVQVQYASALSPSYCFGKGIVNSHTNAYRPSGTDYRDYAVPDGYTMDSPPFDLATLEDKPAEVPPRPRPAVARKGRFFVSVYAIAKNEEKFVDRWMDSMSEADEIVVLDTGSSDGTVAKLRGRGARVEVKEFHPWRFDVARNASMELCSPGADILVCTDLDEVLSKGWRKQLEDAWGKAVDAGKRPTTGQYRYIWNFTADGRPDRTFTYEKVHAPDTCKWTHPVHEILSYHVPRIPVEIPGMVLEHHPDRTKSRASYLPLLEMSVEEDPEDDRNMHYLGREYMFRGEWQKAIDTLLRHLALPRAKWRAERAASMRFIARCYANLGKDMTAELWFYRAMDEAPDQRESAVEFAQWLYGRKAPWSQIAAACRRALAVEARSGSYLTEAEAWGEKPYDLLSLALWNLGDAPEALCAAQKALELAPGDSRIANNVALMEKAVKGE